MNHAILIELFGGLRIRDSKGPATEFPRQQTGALLAWLALYPRRSHTREELMALIWPDDEPESARHKLRQSLYSLRRYLNPAGDADEGCLITTRDTVTLDPHRVITDLALFEADIKKASTVTDLDSRIEHLTQAIGLYVGDLLPGFYLDEIVQERGRLADAYRDALHNLTRALEQAGEFNRAIEMGRKVVALDPLTEEAHCNLMRLYAAAGQPSSVLRQYDELSSILKEQLDEEPSAETRQMMEALRMQASQIVASERNVPPMPARAESERPFPRAAPRRYGLTLLAAIIGVAVVLFAVVRKPERDLRVSEPAAPRLSIAVLPFKSMSGSPDVVHLGDGICEEVTTVLAQAPELRVAARTSAFQFRDSDQDVREIGRKLNVAYLLEGSVRRSGSRVRVTAQLINARDGYHVWSDSFDKHETDFIKIQGEVADRISEVLKIRISAPEASLVRKSQHPEAYEHFLRAQYLYNRRNLKDAIAAIAEYEKAINLDPGFAPAYCGLANACFRRYNLENASSLPLIQRAFASARKAIQLDENLPDAHASLGNLYHFYQADWSASERELRRALELDPNHFDALRWYGVMLFSSARPEKAIPYLRKVCERDPLNVGASLDLAHSYFHARRLDEAISQFDKALELKPGDAEALNGKWATLECAGRFREAAEGMARWFDALPNGSLRATATRDAFRSGGMKAVYEFGAKHAASEYSAGRRYGNAFIAAWYLTRLGRITEALDWLERGYRKDHSLPGILFDIRFDPLREHPRFIRLFKLYGGDELPKS